MRMNIGKTGTALITTVLIAAMAAAGDFEKGLSEIRQRIESGAYAQARNDRFAENFAYSALDLWIAADKEEAKEKASAVLEEALMALAGGENITETARLMFLLQAAGTCGLRNDFDAMRKRVASIEKEVKDADVVMKIEAFQDAALYYMKSRDYDVVSVLKERGDSLRDEARARNTYTCRFMSPAPIGAGGWALSDYIKGDRNKATGFYQYPPRGEGYALIADVAADRPLADPDVKASLEDRETAFFMVYDEKGWHIYVRTDEPDIEKVMVDGGRGSSLEMFFSPGTERATYYQWILRLATGDVNLYHWNTPHRFYRHLKHEPGNFQVETAALEKGWGTAIFIPWECLYDKLPFMAGNDDTWRFSIMRWGPVRMTWGGRVHETGRWGLINWETPTAEQRTAILRRLVRRAWRLYNSAKGGIVDFWNCPRRGDPEFYEAHVKPLIEENDAYAERMQTVQEWDGKTVEDVFVNLVPVWMEFDYEVETLRERYLVEKISSL